MFTSMLRGTSGHTFKDVTIIFSADVVRGIFEFSIFQEQENHFFSEISNLVYLKKK